jgi:Cu+-exporting ATPase
MNDTTITQSTLARSAASLRRRVEMSVGGMTCPHCPPALEKALAATDGVISARVNLANKIAAIDYDPDRVKIADLAKVIRTTGYVPGAAKIRVPIAQMHCASCVTRVESRLKATPGVIDAQASLGTSAVDVEYDPEKIDFRAITAAIEASGHRILEQRPQEVKAAVEADADPEQIARENEYASLMRKFWFAAIVSAPVMALSYPDLIPGLREWMPAGSDTRRIVWALLGLASLPVLVWSGSQFFVGMWDGFPLFRRRGRRPRVLSEHGAR